MRQRLQHYAVMLLTVLTMLLALPVLSASAAAEVKVYDEGERLSATELTEVENRLRQAADYTGMNIAVIMGIQNRSDITIESVCKTTYTQLYGAKTDGLIYYMDLKGVNPYDYIATSGMGQFYYTNSSMNNRIDEIYDALDDYLYPVGSENVYEAVLKFAELVEYYYDAGIPEHYYVYDDELHEYYHVEDNTVVTTNVKPYIDPMAIILCMLAAGFTGLLAALITFFAVKMRYRFKTSLNPTSYVNRKDVQYREQYDHFVRTSTSRVRIESDSGGRSSGGGGGGGGHSSGGFGGGGHHR